MEGAGEDGDSSGGGSEWTVGTRKGGIAEGAEMARCSERMCGAEDEAPAVTGRVAICQVCGTQWQVRSETDADVKGCSFCDAPAEAVMVVSEAPDYSGVLV